MEDADGLTAQESSKFRRLDSTMARLCSSPLRSQGIHQGLGDDQMSGLVGVDWVGAEGIGVAV